MAYKTIQYREKFNKEKGREPSIEEIAKELGVEKEEIAASLDAIQDPVSLQEPVYNDGTENIFVMDQVKDTKNNDENWAETKNHPLCGWSQQCYTKNHLSVRIELFRLLC